MKQFAKELVRLKPDALVAITTPATAALHVETQPIAAFVKRLRCHRCGSQSVLAARKAPPQRAS
jgi:hypothetical protein